MLLHLTARFRRISDALADKTLAPCLLFAALKLVKCGQKNLKPTEVTTVTLERRNTWDLAIPTRGSRPKPVEGNIPHLGHAGAENGATLHSAALFFA